MNKILKLSIAIILISIVFVGCTDSIPGDQINLESLQKQFAETNASKALHEPKTTSDIIPRSRDNLNSMRTVEKVYNGEHNAGITVPGFGVIQSGIDGIHHVLSDSLLSKRTSLEPMVLKFIVAADLQQ